MRKREFEPKEKENRYLTNDRDISPCFVYQDTVEFWLRPLIMASPENHLTFTCQTDFFQVVTDQFLTYSIIDKEGLFVCYIDSPFFSLLF